MFAKLGYVPKLTYQTSHPHTCHGAPEMLATRTILPYQTPLLPDKWHHTTIYVQEPQTLKNVEKLHDTVPIVCRGHGATWLRLVLSSPTDASLSKEMASRKLVSFTPSFNCLLACTGLLFNAHVLGEWLAMSRPTRSARWTTWRSTFRKRACITPCQEFRGAHRHDPAASCNTDEHAVIAAPAPVVEYIMVPIKKMFAKQSEEDFGMVVLRIGCIRWRQSMLGPQMMSLYPQISWSAIPSRLSTFGGHKDRQPQRAYLCGTGEEAVSTNIKRLKSTSFTDLFESRSASSRWNAAEKIQHQALYDELKVVPDANSEVLPENTPKAFCTHHAPEDQRARRVRGDLEHSSNCIADSEIFREVEEETRPNVQCWPSRVAVSGGRRPEEGHPRLASRGPHTWVRMSP